MTRFSVRRSVRKALNFLGEHVGPPAISPFVFHPPGTVRLVSPVEMDARQRTHAGDRIDTPNGEEA